MQEYIFQQSNPLSNFWKVPNGIKWSGLIWPTSEHAYQAAKFIYHGSTPNNFKYVEIIRSQSSPSKAKCLGTQKTMYYLKNLEPLIQKWKPYITIDPLWDTHKINVMRSILKAKFDSSEPFRDLLISTSNMIIKEDSEYDYYWGIGRNGTGSNVLGLLLMELRDSNI